jgi:hypothetical protein
MVSSIPMTTSRNVTLGSLALTLFACFGVSGCAYYAPHSLVTTNIRTTDKDALTSGSKRVEASICGDRVLSIPFGPDPRITTLMAALQEQVTNAVGFEDIEIDISRVNYFFPIYWQDCVHGSAFPLFPVPKAHPKPTAKAAVPAPEAPEPAPAEESAPPADPFAK